MYGCVYVYQSGQVTVVHTFYGWNGATPDSPLVQDSAGNIYGTTRGGGTLNAEQGYGVVFKLGASNPLYAFAGPPDGANPYAGLIVDSVGDLYGTTSNGGAHGFGTVFKVDASGSESVLYSFKGGLDGATPYDGLAMDSAGNLYGTTYGGGSGPGVVFELDSAGTETVLHAFTNGKDGGYPYAGLIIDSAGNLYGTTVGGGHGFGTVFKIDTTGQETVLYAFHGEPDGVDPMGGLVVDSTGNLYGTTNAGGNPGLYCSSISGGCGTVFKIDPSGNETILHSFQAVGSGGGERPEGSLVMDAAGNL
jgi:uncharacterized repeat protein (TIGR03803 family)